MSATVPAVLVDDTDAPNAPAGAFEFFSTKDRSVAGMLFVCPCGCGSRSALDFRPAPSPSWQWDGNREKPTLHPSVHHQITRTGKQPETHWHGWLRAGVWESC